ncbi:MAG: CHC2 zinc finger domain-containing protein [Cyanobacteria bacterium J06638_20]
MPEKLPYIPDDIAEKINEAADLVEIAQTENLQLKKKRNGEYQGDCPFCLGKKKFSLFKSKKGRGQAIDSFKCFKCDAGGRGAAKLLMMLPPKPTYPEALRKLADHYKIDIEAEKHARIYNRKNKKESFRNRQLLGSGITEKSQKWTRQAGEGKWVEADRYLPASLDEYNRIVSGDDMVLQYVGLDGQPMTFKDRKGRTKELVRVRWQHPQNHLSKGGKPMKYKSLYGSPSALWLPQLLIRAFARATPIETLYVQEGEKKSDKMTLHGMYSAGLQGINNLSFGEMTTTFEQLIQRCGVKRVVFVLDSDWHDIGSGENVDHRPKSFFSAVKKFRNYFYGYKNSGIELDIFVAFGKSKAEKGMDDLLARSLKGKEEELKEDFEKAFIDPQGWGTHIDVLNITTMSEYKLLELWHLQTPAEFIGSHLEELRERKEFRVNGYAYLFNEQGQPELKDQIHEDEQFWNEEPVLNRDGQPVLNAKGNEKIKLSFNYYHCWQFLRNRGFHLFRIKENHEGNRYRLVRLQDKVVTETGPHEIQQYVKNYVEQLGRIDVLNMLFRGGSQYLGPDKLSNLWYADPEFIRPDPNTTYLVFKNCYWKITAEKIEQRKLSELSRYIWQSRIIDFEPKLHQKGEFLSIGREGEEWTVKESSEAKKCEMYLLYLYTSNFHWRKKYGVAVDGEGIKHWAEKENPEPYTKADLQDMAGHMVCKMIATGYTLQGYRNKAMMKAVIGMDGMETAVGKSEGGTGKSLVGTQFGMRSGKIIPTFVIDGKKDIDKDPFPFDGLDERHGAIIFDDVRVNFNFEWLFSKITTMVEANWKNRTKLFLDPVPIWILTNHAIKGSSNSFLRRQYLLAFSDFFNGLRSPYDVFGHQLFDDWDWTEWNRYYNFIACCIQTYLRFNDLNKYVIPQQDLEKRKLRQEIGENFLEFAELYFSAPEEKDQLFGPDGLNDEQKGPYRNMAVEKKKVYRDFISEFPTEQRYMNVMRVKQKVAQYCRYAGLEFNPGADQKGRIRSGKVEYLVVADENFSKEQMIRVS